MTNAFFNEEGNNLFGVEDNSIVEIIPNVVSPTNRDSWGNLQQYPAFVSVAVNPDDMGPGWFDSYIYFLSEDGMLMYIGLDFNGKVIVDGKTFLIVDGEILDQWIVKCADGKVRHEGTFASRREAIKWADLGHCCLSLPSHTIGKAGEDQ